MFAVADFIRSVIREFFYWDRELFCFLVGGACVQDFFGRALLLWEGGEGRRGEAGRYSCVCTMNIHHVRECYLSVMRDKSVVARSPQYMVSRIGVGNSSDT